MKYIALLRGVNVGGKNKLPMKELKEALLREGFSQVEIYINSGNILFESGETDELALQARCRALISGQFGVQTPVAIYSAGELADALRHAPAWWGTGGESKHNAIFVIPPATAADVYAQVGATKPEYEKVDSYGRVIFWSAPLKTFSRTRWSKVVGTSAYQDITIRNANTAYKLLELAERGS